MFLFRLTLSTFKVRKMRMLLTVAAIALSVSLVVAVTSGYKSLEASALTFLNRYMGSFDAVISPSNDLQGFVPESLVKEVAADPAVRHAIGRLESSRTVDRPPNKPPPQKNADHVAAGGIPPDRVGVNLIGVRIPGDTGIDSLDITAGHWFDSSDGNLVVVDQVAAERLEVAVGDTVKLPGLHPLTVKVVGIVHKPEFFADRWASIYLPIETLQHLAQEDHPPLVSRISIFLRGGANFESFKQRWTDRLAKIDPNLRLRMRRENAGELEKNLRGIQILSYLGGAVAMLTAMFIIFSALSMGVTERRRTLGMLRAVGAIKSQVFNLLVIEGLILAAIGILVGVPLGMLWIKLLQLKFDELFSAGVVFNIPGMIFAAGGSLLTALCASLLPAWWASRISPLEAMNAHSTPRADHPPIGWAILGLILISLDPAIIFSNVESPLQSLGFQNPANSAQAFRFFGHFAFGLPGIMLGFFLLAPLFVWVVERLLAPILALSFALPIQLLRQQLSTGIWRAAGTAAALMVGLATLIALQIQGHTLIGGWQIPDHFPDIFIWSPDIISWKEQKALAKVPGIAPGEILPVVVTTPSGDSKTSLALATALSGQDVGVMFFGVDPQQALKMIELDFRDNDGHPLPRDQQAAAAARAAEEMKIPRHIIVTDEFRQSRHLKIGDTFPLLTTLHGWQNYTICAIIWSPGADVVISMFDLGHLLDRRTAGSVFGSIADAKNDFGVTGARLFGANLVGGIDKAELLKNVQKALNNQGLGAGDVRHIKYSIERAFYHLLNLISTVAIAAMAVASLGVANTIMASVRSRRWQFGVLRSIGLGRGDLLRLILAEATMLGLVGIALGIAAGLEISIDARRITGDILGYSPDMQIPWPIVAGGCLALLAIAIAASIWPAISVARAQPLDLLQAGRAST
jgi:putative ABC transport system permease protein